MAFIYKKAQSSDCETLARYINQSSEGAIDYLFSGVSQGQTAEQMMAQQLSREVHYSYANSIVAKQKEVVIGMVLSFPASGLMLGEQMKQHYTAQQLQYIRYFVDNKIENSWHLDAICVESEYRRQGVGKELLDKVKADALSYEFECLEVFVFGANTKAIQFYERNGFVKEKEIDTREHEFLSKQSPLILMSAVL